MNELNNFDISDLINEPLLPEPLSLPNVYKSASRVIDRWCQYHSIRLELESLKRQRLCRSLKQAKAEIFILNQTLTQQNHENVTLKEQITTLSSTLFSELACLTQRTHCSIVRIHNLLIAAVPRIHMSEAEHNDLSQQATELLRALQLIRTVVYYG